MLDETTRKDEEMGLRTWLRDRIQHMAGRRTPRQGPSSHHTIPQEPEIAPGMPAREWEELPAYLPVDPAEHRVACIIASAIAAGDHPESKVQLRSIALANPEYQRVATIAAALGAGALEKSSFTVRKIYRKKALEETHAA